MFKRKISIKLRGYIDSYKAIALIGPRQSGKTTLAKSVFSDFEYLSLENPDTRSRAEEDPRLFLSAIKGDVIFDEIQNVPTLLSYLQEILDNKGDKRRFILTGSNSFQISEKISQSLAGRIRIVIIPPLIREELPDLLQPKSLEETLWSGFYPAIYDQELDPKEWLADYYNTYVQKDVRSTLNVQDLGQFDRFIRICAGRVGQLANYSEVASEVGVSQPTALKWISVLETSYLIFRLQPHFKNFKKRIIKSPKIYFYDTGLVCFLLRIENPDQLITHPLRGYLFENWVISEAHKYFYSEAREAPLYFWRDQHGHEIDLILDRGDFLLPIEIKSGSTYHSSWTKNIDWFNDLQQQFMSYVIYGGKENFPSNRSKVVGWESWKSELF